MALALWASPRLFIAILQEPELLLLEGSQFLVLLNGVFPVHYVAGIKFRLGEHATRTLVTIATETLIGFRSASGVTHGGYLVDSKGITRISLAVEVTVGFLNRLEGLAPLRCGDQVHLHCVKALIGNALLEPKDLEVLGDGVNSVVAEVGMEIMLLHVELNVLVESEVPTVTLIPEGLELGQDGCSAGNHLGPAKKLGMKGFESLTAILGLREWLAVRPPSGLAPHSVEDVKYLGRVSKESPFKGSCGLEDFVGSSKLLMGQVVPQDWGSSN
jgi:hypothetical protein